MSTILSNRRSHTFVTNRRAAQAGWLLFALLALSLALPGLEPYRQSLAMVCNGDDCLPGQLTSGEAVVTQATGTTLSEYAGIILIVYLIVFAFCLLSAGLFIWRLPTNGAAVAGAFVLTSMATGTLAAATAQVYPALRPAADFILFVQLAVLMPFLVTIPDGRFHPAWLRWAMLAAVPVAALVVFGVLEPPLSYILSAAIGVFTVGCVFYRYYLGRARPQSEQAIWALTAVLLLIVAQWMGEPLTLLPLPRSSQAALPPLNLSLYPIFGLLVLVAALTCLAVALLGDELFRVEVVLNRALVYTLLTLFVVVVYVLIVGYLSLLFRSQGSVWFSLVATGLVAALFQPLRERVQRFVNGLLYGERDDPYRVIAGLGRRLESTIEPAAVPAAIVETMRESLRLPYAAVAVPRAVGEEVVAADGTPAGEPARFPIIWQGATVGHLLVSPRRGDIELSAADRVLLADLAQQAGPAIHGVRLVADLQRLSANLQQSREQLILAREEERRRLRRDLHDDLAPTLAGLSLRAGTIGELIETDPPRAVALAEHLDAAIRDAVGNVRRLVYDLRPPWLDDLGLLAAIRERALEYSSGPELRVTVDSPETLPPLSAAVEVAAYRIVQEGLMNVIKHAKARNCLVRLVADDALLIEIVDDGIGLPDGRTAGVGLRSIHERAVEVGGTCDVVTSSGSGIRLMVSLPIERREVQ